jgi:hypothetical protein
VEKAIPSLIRSREERPSIIPPGALPPLSLNPPMPGRGQGGLPGKQDWRVFGAKGEAFTSIAQVKAARLLVVYDGPY